MYQNIYDAIHAKSGQAGALKMQCIRTEKETVIGWVISFDERPLGTH